MNKKIAKVVSICVFLSIFIGISIYLISFVEPKVEISFSIEKPVEKEDYVIINLKVNVIQPLFVIWNRNIEIDDLDKILIKDERVYRVSGSRVTHDNKSELKAIYEQRVNVTLRDIRISELIDLFKDTKITVNYNKRFNGKEEKIYYITDYLKE